MFESYQLEVLRKRRAARIFWLIVLISALFLYFFFQGYYPNVRLGMKRIFMENWESTFTGSTDIFHPFGIINVRTTQTDTAILLNDGYYGNNEKRVSDYGNYTMEISKEWYLTNYLKFIIDREKTFFIEKVSLIPRPKYRKLDGIEEIYSINDESIIKTASGYALNGWTGTKSIIYTWSLQYIGGKYFITNTGTLVWENSNFIQASQSINNFIQTCKNVIWKYDVFYCSKTMSLLTEWGTYMTGIIDIQNNLIERSGAIIQISNGNIGKTWTQTGEIDLAKIAIINNNIYFNNSGTLIPKDPKQEIITTPLENIHQVSRLEDDIVFIGMEKWKPHIIIRHFNDPVDRIRDIEFPEHLSYSEIRFHSLQGNLIIETPKWIILIYRGSHNLEWIVEGEILSYTDSGAIYKKDAELWWVDWSEKIQ